MTVFDFQPTSKTAPFAADVYRKPTRPGATYRLIGAVICAQVNERRPGTCLRWKARLHSDPLIVGYGRTREQAVMNAYDQVGGPD